MKQQETKRWQIYTLLDPYLTKFVIPARTKSRLLYRTSTAYFEANIFTKTNSYPQQRADLGFAVLYLDGIAGMFATTKGLSQGFTTATPTLMRASISRLFVAFLGTTMSRSFSLTSKIRKRAASVRVHEAF